MSIKYNFLFLVLFCLISQRTFANGYMRIGTMYMSEDYGSGPTSRTLLDLGMGYVNQKGWALGFLYGTEKSDYSGSTVDRSGIGLSGGWIARTDSGFYVLATYYPTATTTGGFKGTGTQFDLGYKFMINKVAFGPQLSKKHFSFNEQNGVSVNPAFIDDKVDPYFVISTDF